MGHTLDIFIIQYVLVIRHSHSVRSECSIFPLLCLMHLFAQIFLEFHLQKNEDKQAKEIPIMKEPAYQHLSEYRKVVLVLKKSNAYIERVFVENTIHHFESGIVQQAENSTTNRPKTGQFSKMSKMKNVYI